MQEAACNDAKGLVFEVDIEHALEQPRPAHARRCFMRAVGCGIAGFLRWARHERGAQPGMGASTP